MKFTLRKLKSCPKCGKDINTGDFSRIGVAGESYSCRVECPSCGFIGPSRLHLKDAYAAWNLLYGEGQE